MAAEDVDQVLLLAGESLEAPRWTRRQYEQVLRPGQAPWLLRCGLVAISSDNLVGFAAASWLRQETAAEVEGLFVQLDFRRQGIGGALIRACMAWAANAGATAVRLEVRASNTAALGLYHRHGFSEVGIRHAYYSSPREDALLLEAPVPL
jgi:ribosomal-protein-alanine N-acetyltransferase